MRKRNCKKGDKLPDFSGRALSSLGIPADSDCRMPLISVTGSRYVKIEHHNGVLLLDPCCIKLYSRCGIIRIDGSGIAASSMDSDVMMLEGRINAVSFE